MGRNRGEGRGARGERGREREQGAFGTLRNPQKLALLRQDAGPRRQMPGAAPPPSSRTSRGERGRGRNGVWERASERRGGGASGAPSPNARAPLAAPQAPFLGGGRTAAWCARVLQGRQWQQAVHASVCWRGRARRAPRVQRRGGGLGHAQQRCRQTWAWHTTTTTTVHCWCCASKLASGMTPQRRSTRPPPRRRPPGMHPPTRLRAVTALLAPPHATPPPPRPPQRAWLRPAPPITPPISSHSPTRRGARLAGPAWPGASECGGRGLAPGQAGGRSR